jgi:hypothetical protein
MVRILVTAFGFVFLMACATESNNGFGNLGGKTDEFSDVHTGDIDETFNAFAAALDVNLHHVVFPEDLEAPAYAYASVDTGFGLGGTEFWQKFPGGENPTFSYYDGTDYGRRCMYASARRFEAIMSNPPLGLKILKDHSKWNGSFFNWNDDYGHPDSWGDASGARLWAWRTTLVKWISQTSTDGSCYLPTLDMINTLIVDCLDQAGIRIEPGTEAECTEQAGTLVDNELCADLTEDQGCCLINAADGEIQGCRAP